MVQEGEVIEDILKSGNPDKIIQLLKKEFAWPKGGWDNWKKKSDYFMSIDYSDMAFPKPKKKKKEESAIRKRHFVTQKRDVCYLCANLYGDYRQQYTEEHHVLFGSGMRILSEAED